jgi:ElaB/YqjD/DUF883 family membrane-anchored ribosome-binding protein
MANIPNQLQNTGEQLGRKAGEAAEKAQDKGSSLLQKGKDMAQTAADRVSETAHDLGDKAEQATNRLGGRIKDVGQSIRDKGPQSGFLHSATESIADGLESSGEYLQEKGISGMAGDVTDLIRRHPVPALLLAVGVGFLIARSLRS